MKTTIYGLLGMIKDGKAPKKIKIDDSILFLCKINGIRYRFEKFGSLNWDYYIETDRLDDVVEILDEDFKLKEKKIPEKLEEFDIQGLEVSGYSMTQAEYLLEDGIKENREMLNWILDYLKSKGE